MRFSKTLAAIFLCATTLTLQPPTINAQAAARASQKPRARAQAPETEITKEKIEAIISTIEQGGKKKDIAGIALYLAPDFKYKLDGGGRPTREANRAQYIEIARLGMALALDYTYLRKSLTITIAPDGQSATAQSEAFEMVTLAQGTLAAHVNSTATFKIYKGKILIASMDGTISYV